MLFNPFQIKPVLRASWVTGKPQLRTINRASCNCLIDKRLGHQDNLVKKHPGECTSLNQILAAFVLAAEHFKVIRGKSSPDFQQLVRPPPAQCITLFRKAHGDERDDYILRGTVHGLSADAEPLTVKLTHGPFDKRPHDNGCLSGTHRTVTYQGIIVAVWKCEDFLLLGTNHCTINSPLISSGNIASLSSASSRFSS